MRISNIGVQLNGIATVSNTVIEGSIPATPAIIDTTELIQKYQFFFIFKGYLKINVANESPKEGIVVCKKKKVR